MKTFLLSCIIVSSTIFSVAAQDHRPPPPPVTIPAPASNTIMNYLTQSFPEFKNFVKGLNDTRLSETLSQPGPFTVFAVTNAGFESLPADSLQKLTDPANASNFEKTLSYLILAGDFPLETLMNNVMSNGGEFKITTIGHGGELQFGMTDEKLVYLKSALGNNIILTEPQQTANGKVYKIPFLLRPASVVEIEKEAEKPLEPVAK